MPCDRYSRDSETKPRGIELSIIVSQDCDHAPTSDAILTFYRHNITHIQVYSIVCSIDVKTFYGFFLFSEKCIFDFFILPAFFLRQLQYLLLEDYFL